MSSIISNNAGFRNYLQNTPSQQGLDSTGYWFYDNDFNTYGGCSYSSAGVNLAIGGVENESFAQLLDETLDDGNLACGAFHRLSSTSTTYLYTLHNN